MQESLGEQLYAVSAESASVAFRAERPVENLELRGAINHALVANGELDGVVAGFTATHRDKPVRSAGFEGVFHQIAQHSHQECGIR